MVLHSERVPGALAAEQLMKAILQTQNVGTKVSEQGVLDQRPTPGASPSVLYILLFHFEDNF